MFETIIGITVFVLGAIVGTALVVMYELNKNADAGQSEAEMQWQLMIDDNRRLLKESMEH